MSDDSGAHSEHVGNSPTPPRFSVLTTVYDTEPDHLRACLESVDAQTEHSWEHIVVDDASQRPAIRTILSEFCQRSNRRTVIFRPDNGGIVSASNDALAAASGDFVVLLDHDDVLSPDALSSMGEHLRDDVDVYYSDHDLLRVDGRCAAPMYKPDFSLERLRNQNYITHLVVARRTAVEEVGGFRTGFDGAQDHDLLLRLAEVSSPFEHVPKVLLHWRQAPASVASNSMNKPDAYPRGARAVGEHLARSGIDATVEPGQHPGIYRLRRRVCGRPTVSVIVLTGGARGRIWGVERIFVHDAVASLLAGIAPDDIDLEIVAVIDDGTDSVVRRGLQSIAGDRFVVVSDARLSNSAEKINAGVAVASGDYVLLFNENTELLAPGSVREMVGLAHDPSVGMVGAKLLFEDGRLQHGGQVDNGRGRSNAFLGWQGGHPGPYAVLAVERECSGVSTAAALLRREVFDEVGGMVEALDVNDHEIEVDLSLRVRAAGFRIIWTPHASWYHFAEPPGEPATGDEPVPSVSEPRAGEPAVDQFYNANLAPGRSDWLELPLRSGAPPYEVLPDGRIAWS
jgi:GT2 family glycosyltransferase